MTNRYVIITAISTFKIRYAIPEEVLACDNREDLIDKATDAVIAESVAQADSFWHIRETIPLSKRAYGTALNQDISVPISRIPDFIKACNQTNSSDFIVFEIQKQFPEIILDRK